MRDLGYRIVFMIFIVLYAGMSWAAETDTPLQLLGPQQGAQATTPEPSGMHDIYSPIPLPEPAPYLTYGLLALAALILLAGLYWWFARRPRPVPPPVPPAIIARDELMRARELMNREQAVAYMERVSGILRRYLESRFTLPTSRQTTQELFRDLARETGDRPEQIARFQAELKSCLELCDLAKYAHRSASLELMQQMEEQVLHFINTTESEPQTGGGDS